MNDEIKVYVINKGRKYLYLRYIDPLTGKPIEKSAKTAKRIAYATVNKQDGGGKKSGSGRKKSRKR